MKLTGNEKAFLGGLATFLTSSIGLLISAPKPGYTLKDFVLSVASWIVVHSIVWTATNSPVPVVPPVTATTTPKEDLLNGVAELTPQP